MESNPNTDVDKLIAFGQMALEQGWYEQARDYFQQALALDASNREAMKGLARVNEILSRRMPTPVEPTRAEPVKPRPKVATTNKMMYGLAAILVLAVVTLVWMAYSIFIEPRREVAIAPTAAAISTETPKPTPTLKLLLTPTQKEPTPTPVVLAETIFGEAVQREIYFDYVEAWRSNIGDKDVCEEIAHQWGTTVDIVKAIAIEGFKKNWVTPTPLPTYTPQPTAAPPKETTIPSEEAYLSQFYEIIGIYANSSHELALLEQDIFSDFQQGGIEGWNSRCRVVNETIRQTGERVRGLEVPARYERVQQELRQASRYFEDAAGALLTAARQMVIYGRNRTMDQDESCRLMIERARLGLESASECIGQATKKLEQLALPTAALPATVSDHGVTAEESAYLAQYDIIVTDYLYSVSELQTLMKQVRRGSPLMTDKEWLSKIADVIAMWTTRGEDARRLEAPPRLEGVHRELVQASKHYDRAGALLIEEIGSGNANKLPSPSNDEATLGWESLERATDELEKYAEGLGILTPRTPTPVGTAWHEVGRWECGETFDYQVQTEYFHIPSNEWRVSWETWPGENYGEGAFLISTIPASVTVVQPGAELFISAKKRNF
jgi:hypothetical protein